MIIVKRYPTGIRNIYVIDTRISSRICFGSRQGLRTQSTSGLDYYINYTNNWEEYV